MHDVSALVQIGITTKNRWDDLRVTLEKIRDFGLGELSIVIFDDHSDEPCPYDVRELCSNAQLTRFDTSRGLIVRRNEIAQAMTAKYYLSLDDDSFPSAGSLEAAVDYAESLTDNFCLGFPICAPRLGAGIDEPLQASPSLVRAYTGCAHLLDRQRFLDIGGYRGELIHQGEESEAAVRAFQQRLFCRHFPGFQITHMATSVARSMDRIEYYGVRNTLLWNDWYLPPPKKLVKQGRAIALRVYKLAVTWRSRRVNGSLAGLKGSLAGLKDIRRYKAYRQPLSPEQYREWQKLPLS
ncbi:MAG: glycosyltransferase family 2 protein [Janthinobacterium lividum]